MNFQAIGAYHCQAQHKQQAARQGVFSEHPCGTITLHTNSQFEMALRDLDGFERIWLIYVFHQNLHWRPTTRPPIPLKDRDRVGVFASRSPYRPNPIGICAARLQSIHGLVLTVTEADLLNGTPILDIKPYIPRFDAFPNAKQGWLAEQSSEPWSIEATSEFTRQAMYLKVCNGPDLADFCQVQLSFNPLDSSRKRVQQQDGKWVIAFRTWRITFSVDEQKNRLLLERIHSGYSEIALRAEAADPYSDKDLHRTFYAMEKSMQ